MGLLWMAAILDFSNMAPTAGVQLGTREKSKVYDLGCGSNLVLVERFEQFRGKYGLSPLTNILDQRVVSTDSYHPWSFKAQEKLRRGSSRKNILAGPATRQPYDSQSFLANDDTKKQLCQLDRTNMAVRIVTTHGEVRLCYVTSLTKYVVYFHNILFSSCRVFQFIKTG